MFTGYSGPDIKMTQELLEIVDQYPNLNFGFKAYMSDEAMEIFTSLNIERMVTPIILSRRNKTTKLLSTRLKLKEELKELFRNFK